MGWPEQAFSMTEAFNTVDTSVYGKVSRVVAFARLDASSVPESTLFAVLGTGLSSLIDLRRKRLSFDHLGYGPG